MRAAFVLLALPLLAVQLAVAQSAPPQAAAPQAAPAPSMPAVEDFKPATSNQPGKQYPQVNSERRARFRIVAPQAQSVRVSLGDSTRLRRARTAPGSARRGRSTKASTTTRSTSTGRSS